MLLSDAILKGCEQHSQTWLKLFVHNINGTHTCALGAAYVGVFGTVPATWSIEEETNAMLQLRDFFPVLTNELVDWITDCNDELHWTREKIAMKLKDRGL